MQYGLSIGAEAYFLKPFTPDELVENIKNILLKYNKYQGTQEEA